MRNTVFLNDSWEFTESFSEQFLSGRDCDCAAVDLPHTVKETPFHYFDEKIYQMLCGYRRRLTLPEGAENKRVFLIVEAAAHYAEVFLDGELLNAHKGGYTAFETELTGRLKAGAESLLCIKVDSRESLNFPPFGKVIDYLTYGGLYRGVRLEIREQSFIKDIFAIPAVPAEITLSDAADKAAVEAVRFTGTLECRAEVENAADCALKYEVYDYHSNVLLISSDDPTMQIENLRLWDVLSPALYTLKTKLIKNSEIIDCVETAIGFRRAEFRKDGFFLNGRRLKIVGLNRHQSYPYFGYAAPKSLQRYDAELLKNELGLNAVRTSHYPQSQHFIDRCDELGLMVFTEAPGWQYIGDEAWKNVGVEAVKEMVLQYRNHPSIILWGVRINESVDDDPFYRRTNDLSHSLDPSRMTGGVRCYKKGSFLEDVYTFNDFSHTGNNPGCEPKENITPDTDRPYMITEYNGHMYPTKSFDNEEWRLEHMLRHTRVLDAVASHDDICGSFGWCFFDYNTHKDFGSGDRVCYHGVCDMFRNPKLAASVYAVRRADEPVLEVSSSMDIGEHPASFRGRIYIITNADSVRFYQNDTFIREYTHADSEFTHLYLPPIEITDFIGDRLRAETGYSEEQADAIKAILNHTARFGMNSLTPELMQKAAWLMQQYGMTMEVAYQLYAKYIENWGCAASVYRFEAIKDGKVVKTLTKEAFSSLRLWADVSSNDLYLDETYDMAAIRIRMTDQNGNVLPFYQNDVIIDVEGPVTLVGQKTATLRGGMGGAYIRTTGASGTAKLTLRADGAEPIALQFTIHNGGNI